jgi:uncharacterized protein (DUF1800 family)
MSFINLLKTPIAAKSVIAMTFVGMMSLLQAGEPIFSSGMDESPEGPYSKADASRFLTQATFGPTLPEIDRLYRMGYNAWLDEQFNPSLPVSVELPFLDGLIAQAVNAGLPIEVWQDKRIEVWFKNALTGNDQLRQRMAFALSEILVISDQNGALEGNPTTLADYYDKMANGAFGSYRTLLENVTLHPAMGVYLSMHMNRKPSADGTIRPDENYAREIMQLFSVGLVRLNTDGTVMDGDATAAGIQPIPTYTQDTIRGLAHVFTGWNYSTCVPPAAAEGAPGFNYWEWDYCGTGPEGQDWRSHIGWRTPMKPWGEGTAFGDIYHAVTGTKLLLNYPGAVPVNGILPAGGTARANMTAVLNNVANHPNVGPFLSRLLIQRFVTSNPSPAYVGRVAGIFNNNGAGVRGDLKAVVRAILLDTEARKPTQAYAGKLREPLMRITQLWRAMSARSVNGRINEGWTDNYSAQAPMRSPTVFNFFQPGYQLPGEIANAGLYSPEMQITTDTYITRMVNELGGKIYWYWLGNPGLDPTQWDPVQIDIARDMAIANDARKLIDRYDLLFMSGRMPTPMYNLLVTHVNDINLSGGNDALRERLQDALWLILTSPSYVVEK